MRIDSRESLEGAALKYGILPFFSNRIPGFSVHEMCMPGMLFGGNSGDDGCWEWKGPVIREQNLAYGKFFRRKAGFVSKSILKEFLDYRRAAYPISEDSLEALVYNLLKEKEGATSAELRTDIFQSLPKGERPRRHVLEPALQRLQMGGWILIADFEYKYTARGDRYGWGVALYSTPEIWLDFKGEASATSVEDKFNLLVDKVLKLNPSLDRKDIEYLLK